MKHWQIIDIPQDIGRVLLESLYNNAFCVVNEKKKTAEPVRPAHRQGRRTGSVDEPTVSIKKTKKKLDGKIGSSV